MLEFRRHTLSSVLYPEKGDMGDLRLKPYKANVELRLAGV